MVLPPMNVAARIVSKFKKENAESAITRYGFSVENSERACKWWLKRFFAINTAYFCRISFA